MTHPEARLAQPSFASRFEHDFVVADPHVVYYDAVMNSPWSHDGGGHLPERDDWSTYRYAVKDLILAVATHRFNKNARRLEIRGYFVGEHPLFKELEPTKAMVIVFCCQSYQSGGTLELFFEHGVPYDIRTLIERRLGVVVSGHEQRLGEDLATLLFAELSSFSKELRDRIAAEVPLDSVCYNTYRGTWSANQVTSLLHSGIPLRWIFKVRPDPLRNALSHSRLMNHLRAVLLEEYALRRLEDRPMGESLGIQIQRQDHGDFAAYIPEKDIHIVDEEANVLLPANEPFCLLPVVRQGTNALKNELPLDLARLRRVPARARAVFTLPMDFAYLSAEERRAYRAAVVRAGGQALMVGVTNAHMLTEAEMRLAMTSSAIDADEVDADNVDRYPD